MTFIPGINKDDVVGPVEIMVNDQVYIDPTDNKLYAVVREGELIWKNDEAVVEMQAGNVKEISLNNSVVYRDIQEEIND